MISDEQTNISQLREVVHNFVAARDWQPFHTPKNLSMAIAVEAAEMMGHYQWEGEGLSWQPGVNLYKVQMELADVFIYCLAMANVLGIDLTTAILAKIEMNGRKYPARDNP